MPSYIEGKDNIQIIVDHKPATIKPILFADYKAVTKYDIKITYEDSTEKYVELIQNDKNRPYKIIYKKEGKLFTVIGVPKVYEINEASKFCDFPNRIMDSKDLLFEVDCSDKYECSKARFYLKDIRDIVDIVAEGFNEDPEDNMEAETFTMYPIYLNDHSCQNTIHCTVDDELKVILTSEVTKMGNPLEDEEYSDFTILSVTSPVTINEEIEYQTNKVPLIFTEESLDTEIKIILKYFIKEIDHPVFDEFTVIASKKKEESNDDEIIDKVVTSQDTQYLGDKVDDILDLDLTPGFKPYRYKDNEQ